MIKKQKIPQFAFIFLAITLLGLSAGILATQNTLNTRSRAEDNPPNCASDPASFDYCGESRPFRGCNSPPAEWICQCRLPSGKWWSECSVAEDSSGKQKYIDKCGGDGQKAFTQWKYDIAILETEGQCSCGGQNICGSLVPAAGKKAWPTEFPVVSDIPIPSPTLIISEIPTQLIVPTTRIYVVPASPAIVNPTVEQQIAVVNTPTPTSVPKPLVNINFDAMNKFIADTRKSILEFFSQVLP